MSCQRADELLDDLQSAGPVEIVNATKIRYGRNEAIALARTKANKLVTGRGEKLTTIDLKKDEVDDDMLAGLLLGPTGNLKAPTILVGKTLIVGFNATAYEKYLS